MWSWFIGAIRGVPNQPRPAGWPPGNVPFREDSRRLWTPLVSLSLAAVYHHVVTVTIPLRSGGEFDL